LTIHQGDDLSRPSLLLVDLAVGVETGIRVSGRAVPIDHVQGEHDLTPGLDEPLR
jgi:predicted PhzF superfamily epimerase YddE/YHI9